MKNFRQTLEYYVFPYKYYVELVGEKRLFFRSEASKSSLNQKLLCSWKTTILPAIIVLPLSMLALFFITFKAARDYEVWRIMTCVTLLRPQDRMNIIFTVVFWGGMHFTYTFYVLRNNLNEFKPLAVFAVDDKPNSPIKPADLRLSRKQFRKLARFRQKAIFVVRYCTLVAMSVATAGLLLSFFFIVPKSVNRALIAPFVVYAPIWVFFISAGKEIFFNL